MLFSSIPFLFFFLSSTLLIYFIFPKRLQNLVLLLVSIIFYYCGEPKYVYLLLFSILSCYIFGLLIEKYRQRKAGRIFFICSAVISIALLIFFKYTDFFISNVNAVTGSNIPLLKLALPIGISFYTFQILSYTIDVYRGVVPAQKNIISLGAYVALFPQLIAGPIVRYTDVERELSSRTHSFENFSKGAFRFVTGLSKKILLANALGELCDIFRNSDDKSILFFWMYGIAFCLHIYFDFSGYSDMAIGLGRIFGFNFPENFNYPYISRSITEFWRRWHMTLGSWFRDYVYIPLGGNRVSLPRWFFNIAVVWFLTGFWHGAAWNFIVWGVYFAVWLILEKLFLAKWLDKAPEFVRHIYVLFLIMISFIIFNADNMSMALSDISGLFYGHPFASAEAVYYLRSYLMVLITGIIGATPLIKTALLKLYSIAAGEKALDIITPVIMAALLLLCTAYLVDGSFNPFLYFRF